MSTAPTTQITGKQLMKAVRDIATADPAHVYVSAHENRVCCYRNPETNEPDCIIGRALDALGVLPQEMGLGNTISVRLLLDRRSPVVPVKEISQMQLAWLSRVQSYQDGGDAWGDAVRKADKQVSFL